MYRDSQISVVAIRGWVVKVGSMGPLAWDCHARTSSPRLRLRFFLLATILLLFQTNLTRAGYLALGSLDPTVQDILLGRPAFPAVDVFARWDGIEPLHSDWTEAANRPACNFGAGSGIPDGTRRPSSSAASRAGRADRQSDLVHVATWLPDPPFVLHLRTGLPAMLGVSPDSAIFRPPRIAETAIELFALRAASA